jgi:membrane protease YdiL (CAAX protease family)
MGRDNIRRNAYRSNVFLTSAFILTAAWLAIVALRFRRSTPVLLGGLVVLGLYTVAALVLRLTTAADLGLSLGARWPLMLALAVVWVGLMLAYSPVADALASRWFHKPPTLGAFRAIQQSTLKLVGGILFAWTFGGVLEELALRGVVLKAVETWLSPELGQPLAAALAIVVAALGATILHIYQGPRAMAIITQLSVLFGVLFVLTGYNLWSVMLCHGLYDTVAFVRFAARKSKYSNLDGGGAAAAT